MSFSEIFIRRPVATTLLTVVMVVFGVWAYFQLPVNSLPTVDYPVIQVSVSYPGASPATMASSVALPLENEFTQIGGLQSMVSDNKQGTSVINLTFDLNRDVDLVAPDVQAAITRATRNLPQDLPNPPTYKKFNPSEAPIFYLVMHSETLSHADLYDYASHFVSRRLSMTEGVSYVQAFGAKRAIRIQFDPSRLTALQIGIDEIAQALRTATVNIPGGSLNGAMRTFMIEPQGQLRTAEEYADVIIATRENASIRLRDVATCVDSIANDLVNILYCKPGMEPRGKCVVMAISRVTGANTAAVADRISATLNQVRKELPAAVSLETMFNGAGPIRESLHDVQITVAIALVLVVLTIFLFLGRIRETIIPSIILPISLVGTLLCMLPSGFNLDMLSLMGIVLAVGFLVDDAIVVLENTVRHLDSGMKPVPAAIRSMKEISFTVISTSIALIIVFLPLVFMRGAVGRNLREFALTVIYAILVSTILALTLSPMMCARILRHNAQPNLLQRGITATIQAMINAYGHALRWQLRHKWIALLAWMACIAGSAVLYFLLPKSFLPPGDSSFIRGALIMPQGASSEQMQAFQTKVVAILSHDPAVHAVGSVTGFQPGADQSLGYIFIRLRPPSERPPIEQLTRQFMQKLATLPDGVCSLRAVPVLKISAGADTTAAGSEYAFMLTGLNRDAVYNSALRIEQAMRQIPQLNKFTVQNSVKMNMPVLSVTLDRDRASSMGVTAQSVEQALALSFAGGFVTQFTTDQDQYQVIPEIAKSAQRLPDHLSSLYVRSSYGSLVPLRSVVKWTEQTGPQNIPHASQQESATLSFSAWPGIPLGIVIREIEAKIAGLIPQGVKGEFVGDAMEFKRSIASLTALLLIAVFLKYIVLGILYESYIHPFTILTTLPVAVVGGFLSLFAFRAELSLYAYIGVFVLLGHITKNGILMVDFAIQRKGEGMSSQDAIVDACMVRFRPILMTGMCAILGALPIALGYGADASSRIPLGLVIVGGMIFAQIITLFITPSIYLYMETIQSRFRRNQRDDE